MGSVNWKEYSVEFNRRSYLVRCNEDTGEIEIDGHTYTPVCTEEGFYYDVTLDGFSYKIMPEDGTLFLNRHQVDFAFKPAIPKLVRSNQDKKANSTVVAPLPSIVAEVHVKVGDIVKKGEPLVTLEAMKMRNDVPAQIPGKVTHVRVSPGDSVEAEAPLVLLSSIQEDEETKDQKSDN